MRGGPEGLREKGISPPAFGLPMKIKVHSGPAERHVEIADGSTPEDILKVLSLHPDAHLIVRDNAPIPLDEELRDGDSIKVIKVASGG